MKWWEKTVEYFFILNCVGKHMRIAPLDGREERAGDVIFSSDNHWVLIEFKRDVECLKSEEKKFTDYFKAKDQLKDMDKHHFLIFGKMFQEEEKNRFGLVYQTYFTGNSVTGIESILESGIELDDFVKYLEEFTSYKKVSDGSDGSVDSGAFALVAGINSDNEIVECVSLAEMAKELNLELSPENSPDYSSSMGM